MNDVGCNHDGKEFGRSGKNYRERWRNRIEEVISFWKEGVSTVSNVVKNKENKHW